MYTSGKKKNKLFCENKVQRKNRILKSGIQPLMESEIHGCGIRNPQTWNPESTPWNPESKTLLDYLTWGEPYTHHYSCALQGNADNVYKVSLNSVSNFFRFEFLSGNVLGGEADR